MKKKIIFAALFILISLTISAQGLYFDAGFGLGHAYTRLGGENAINIINTEGLHAKQYGMYMGLKAGYGPVADMPLYIVGEIGLINHVLELQYISEYPNQRGSFDMSLSSIIIGPGILFYPIPLLQLGASAGFSFVNNTTDVPDDSFSEYMYDSKGGFAWNATAALDFGRRNHGCLVGVQIFNAINPLQVSNITKNAFLLSVFVKYTYRQKPQLLFW